MQYVWWDNGAEMEQKVEKVVLWMCFLPRLYKYSRCKEGIGEEMRWVDG